MSLERLPELEVASLSGEVDAVMRGIVERAMALPGADGASLSTTDGAVAFFRVCAGEDAPLEGLTLPLAETLGAECIARGGVTVLRRTTGTEVDRCLTPGAAAIVLAPIEWNGTTRGILGVRSADTEAFDENGVEKLRMLAAGASIALRNAEVVEALVASERMYRELHDSAADAVLVTHASSHILDANDAAASLLGYSVDELRTMLVTEIFSPAELTALPLRNEEIMERGELRSERPFLRKDGSEVMVEYSCRALSDGRVHTTLRDVTQRRRNEERLRTNLGRLHSIVQTQQEISSIELDQDAATTTLVHRAQRLAGGDGAAVQWFEEDVSVYAHCSGVATPHVGMRLERAGSLAGLAALVGEALYASDTASDPRVNADVCARVGVRSLVCAPLYHDGQVQGTLSVMSRRPNAFDDLALETIRLMAEFVSSVTRNAAELETRRQLMEQLETQGLVVRHMQTALWVFDVDGDELRLSYANAASEAATGLVADEIVGTTIDEVLPAAADELKAVLRQVQESRLPVDAGEVEYGDARIRPGVFTVRAFPVAGDRVAVTFDNVTEVARARRALQESESRFRGAFHSSAVGMALTALDGTFVQVNERLAELLGYTIDEVMQLGVRGITHPDDLPIDLDYMRRLKAGEIDEFEREKRYLRKDGSAMWSHLTVSLVRGYDGVPTHVVSHIQDITAQKEANLLFQATFEQSVVPKIVTDDKRRLVRVNQAAAELLGVDVETALGLRVDDLFADQAVEELWPRFIEAGRMEAEAWFHAPGGAKRRVEFVATANVQPGRHVAVVRDLTRQKELEAQLRQAQKMEAVGRLAGGIAHDFNNLLTAISGYSEFLIDGEEDERLRRHAEEIKKAAARAAALTGQLLAFSRRQVLQPRVLDLNDVVSDMDMMLRRLIGEDVELVDHARPGSGVRARRPDAGRAGDREPRSERARRNAARRLGDDRDVEPEDRPGLVRRPATDRHRHRHDRRRTAAALRPVLHDEGRRHRARSRDRVRNRRPERRHDRGRVLTGPRLVLPDPAAGSRSTRPGSPGRAPGGGAAARRRDDSARRRRGDRAPARRGDPRDERLHGAAGDRRPIGARAAPAAHGPRRPAHLRRRDARHERSRGCERGRRDAPRHAGALHLRLHGFRDRAPRRARARDRVPAEAVRGRRSDPRGAGDPRRGARLGRLSEPPPPNARHA